MKRAIMRSLMRAAIAWAALLCAAAPSTEPAAAEDSALQQGERMYREGLLPSGKPLRAFVQGDIPVEGTAFTCVSCHVRSGMGSFEGGVVTLPTNGETLYRPFPEARRFVTPGVGMIPFFKLPKVEAPPRPAYTDATLAAALRAGVDPAGRTLDYVMPRYELGNRDMEVLISFLKSLSAKPSPGVTDTELRFATVIAGDVSPRERREMLSVLDAVVIARNSAGVSKMDQQTARWAGFAGDLARARRKMSIAVWELKGPPGSWRRQLEERYRRDPVFALLAGISSGEWKPVHDFCEANRIPCLFPITDFPVISATDWYTQYFSKGYYQEGEAAARFIAGRPDVSPDMPVLQLYADTPEARALAEGFRATWRDMGRSAPLESALPQDEKKLADVIRKRLARDKPGALLLWAGSEAFAAIEAVAEAPGRPAMLCLSSSVLRADLLSVPDSARGFAYITYPYRLALDVTPGRDLGKGGMVPVKNPPMPTATRNVALKTGAGMSLLPEVFMMMMTNFYRDYLLDIVAMCADMKDSPYERLSFGPGQRYASKGCYVVQLTRGPDPSVVKKSNWVIH